MGKGKPQKNDKANMKAKAKKLGVAKKAGLSIFDGAQSLGM